MNYKIIADEQAFLDFVDWLPDLLPAETIYFSLLARNKYLADRTQLKGDKCSLKRGVSKKEYLFRKIKQLECPVGSYEQDGKPIPQEAICLYVTPNPVSQEKAAKQLLKQLADVVTVPYNGYNIHQLALSQLQENHGRKIFGHIDFDNVSLDDVIPKINLNKECLTIIKTRGGFHILIEFEKMDKKYEKVWYKQITSLDGADVTKANLLPAVGTFQGMFVPELIKL